MKVIAGGTVVTASDTFAADVWVDGGKIVGIVQPGTVTGAGAEKIDATGAYVIPGGIDCHTHMELPFGGTTASDDFESGTIAAAYGGTTTIVDFAIQSKGGSMRAGLDAWHAKAEGKAAIDYGFHMIMTEANPSALEDMAAMIREGVTSFKMFMAYPGVFLVDDEQIFKAMLKAGELGALITMHAEIGLPIDVLVQQALAKRAPRARVSRRSRAPRSPRRPAPSARSRSPRWPASRCTWCTCRRSARSSASWRRARPACRHTRRPSACKVLLFCSEDDLRGEPGNEWKGAGYVCTPLLRKAHHHEHLVARPAQPTTCRSSRPTTRPFCMKDQKELGKNDFSKISTACPASR